MPDDNDLASDSTTMTPSDGAAMSPTAAVPSDGATMDPAAVPSDGATMDPAGTMPGGMGATDGMTGAAGVTGMTDGTSGATGAAGVADGTSGVAGAADGIAGVATGSTVTSTINPVDVAATNDAFATPMDTGATTTIDTGALNETMMDNDLFGVSSDSGIPAEIVRHIGESKNVLVALSADPSVDEMAAAIGLSLYLDKLGKRATAIYSGATPNALEFLKPEETFEPTVDALQDFVIALNKEKADHLRYKLDGDYVKIYITPYRSRISEEDLDFSYGDFNVDLVLALDVANGVDLDKALREHGRIMHDAVIVNVTTGNPGKLGEIEWSDKRSSSVSEMIARLLYSINGDTKVGKEEATAFLTGIVAATNRFSTAATTPETMRTASRLMESGANQQLIARNITPDVENEVFRMLDMNTEKKKSETDPTKINIAHGEGEVDDLKEVSDTVTEKESTLLDDLKAAEASLASAGAETTPEKEAEPLKIDSDKAEAPKVERFEDEKLKDETETPKNEQLTDEEQKNEAETPKVERFGNEELKDSETKDDLLKSDAVKDDLLKNDAVKDDLLKNDAVKDDLLPPPPAPPIDLDSILPKDDMTKTDPMDTMTGDVAATTAAGVSNFGNMTTSSTVMNDLSASESLTNGLGTSIPPVVMNPMGDSGVSSTSSFNEGGVKPIEPATPKVEPEPSALGAQPAMQDQVYRPQAADPSAFKIPGM